MDHGAIAETLRREVGGSAEVVATECLWACDLSNVVVVNPSPAGRAAGAKPAWVTHVNTVERARLVVGWVRDGGPGLASPPDELGEVHTAAGLRRITATTW